MSSDDNQLLPEEFEKVAGMIATGLLKQGQIILIPYDGYTSNEDSQSSIIPCDGSIVDPELHSELHEVLSKSLNADEGEEIRTPVIHCDIPGYKYVVVSRHTVDFN